LKPSSAPTPSPAHAPSSKTKNALDRLLLSLSYLSLIIFPFYLSTITPMPNHPIFRLTTRAHLILLLVALTLLTLTLAAPDLFARAGGGESFSGGGGSGGGGGGGGDGGGDGLGILVYFLIRILVVLCVEHPIIGIPLTLAVIAAFIYISLKSQSKYQDRTLGRGYQAITANTRSSAIGTLRTADPSFDPDLFTQRVKNAFLTLQDGWSNQDISHIRPFASDGVVERFTLQFQEQKDEGYRNQMSDVIAGGAVIIDARTGPVFQSATVVISATAIDTKVDAQTGKLLSGSESPDTFTEYWTFLRRPAPASSTPSTPSTSPQGLLEGRCPNCGAPITDASASPDAAYKCLACGSSLLSGTHDWVLAEISQTSASAARVTGAEPASIRRYQADIDPGFSSANLEDRASVVFWRWAKSWRTASPKPLQKVAHPDFTQSIADLIKSHTNASAGTRSFPGKCAVGSVEALGVLPASIPDTATGVRTSVFSDSDSDSDSPTSVPLDSNNPSLDPDFDNAFVLIEWSATTHTGPARPTQGSSKPKPVPGGGLYCVSLLTLSRKKGVTTNPALGLASAHCPSCGAPESDSAADACPFCGSVLNDGSAGWILTRMEDASTPASRATINRLRATANIPLQRPLNQTAPVIPAIPSASESTSGASGAGNASGASGGAMALWLASAILADDKVTDRERELFAAFCQKQNIDPDHAQAILDTAIRENASGETARDHPSTPDESRAWLAQLAATLYATGTPTRDDHHLLLTAAHRAGIPEKEANQINSQARTDALARAKAAIKQQKQTGSSGILPAPMSNPPGKE
jgi:hypothetical protein